MIKKILILIILGAAGYVGYLVWSNLSPKEKSVVTRKLGEVTDDAKGVAKKAADSLTDKAKDAIDKMDDGSGSKPAPAADAKADEPAEKPDEKKE